MRAPAFWWRKAGLGARLLQPLAAVYGAVATWRLNAAGREVGVPVVCVGDPTVGGGGKTPAALAVAQLLIGAGERPAFLTRGYGGRLAGPIRVDLRRHVAADVGDEPLLLGRCAETIVARDRGAGAHLARANGASVIVMDDGFQNPSLVKHLALLVIDGRRGLGNGRVVPAGPLRAPLDRQLARADAIIVIGAASGAEPVVAACRARGLAVFRGRIEPDAQVVERLAGQRALAFAGIGDAEKFFATLRAAKIVAVVERTYTDHHRYTPGEAAALIEEAERRNLLLLTTEKDQVRFAGDPALAGLAHRARALPVALTLDDVEGFGRFVLAGIARARAGGAIAAQVRGGAAPPRD